MRHGFAALVAGMMLISPAGAVVCNDALQLNVDPPEKAAGVAATLTRRLQAAGIAGAVSVEGEVLRATVPAGVDESLLTRPARIEFRLVAKADDAPGAVSLARLQGGRESVDPEIILDESHLREFKVSEGADHAAIAFRFDPHAMKNLMSATADGVGRKLAIIVDDVVVADPLIRAPVGSMNGEIDAGLSPASARELAALLPDGRLSGRVTVAPHKTACPTP